MGLLRFLSRLFKSAPRYEPHVVSREEEFVPFQLPARRIEPAAPTRAVISGRCYVIDGDTITIDKYNIRLAGIDAPELDHPYGKNAKWALYQLCKGHVISAEVTGAFSYERVVAVCRLPDGRDLSAEMVRQGMAIDWAKHSGGKYRGLEPEGIRKKLWRADARQKGRWPPPGSAKSLN